MSTSAQQIPLSRSPVERRFYPRIIPNTPIIMAFNESVDSLLLNISENGLLVSTSADLAPNSVARLSISLSGLHRPVRVSVRVIWASDARKLAGIQLLDLSEHDRERIRKWGTREFAQSDPHEPNCSLPAVPAFKSPSDTAQATCVFAEDPPVSDSREMMPLAPSITVRARSTSLTERCVIAGLYLAAACLVTVFFLRNEALGNPFARSKHNPSPSNLSPSLPPIVGVEKSNAAIVGTPSSQNSLQTSKPPAREVPIAAAASATKSRRENSPIQPPSSRKSILETNRTSENTWPNSEDSLNAQNDLSVTAEIPSSAASVPESTVLKVSAPAEVPEETTDEVPNQGTPETLVISSVPPAPRQHLQNATRIGAVPVATSAEVSPSALAAPHLNSIVAPARPTLSAKSDPSVIQMDPPRNQTLEVHLSSGYQSSFFGLPGKRVVETPTITISIQRFVLMPSSQGGWFANRNKKVVVGELISRADPQPEHIPDATPLFVRVRVTIARDGHIENVKLISGSANLFRSIAKALREWRYQPTRVDDKPVKTQSDVVFEFHAPSYRTAKR